jgi:hypothetical protein
MCSGVKASVTLPALVILGKAASDSSGAAAVGISMEVLPLALQFSSCHLHLISAFAAAWSAVDWNNSQQMPEDAKGQLPAVCRPPWSRFYVVALLRLPVECAKAFSLKHVV